MNIPYKSRILRFIFKSKTDAEILELSQYFQRFYQDSIKPHRKLLIIALIFMGIFAGTTSLSAWLIRPIMNSVFIFEDYLQVTRMGAILVVVAILKAISQYSYSKYLVAFSATAMGQIRKTLYTHYLKQDLSFFHKQSPGTLISIMMQEINRIEIFLTEVPVNLGRDLLTFIGLCITMLILNPYFGILVMIFYLLIVIPIKKANKKIKEQMNKTNAGYRALVTKLEQSLNGIKEVKAYSMEPTERNEFNRITDGIVNMQIQMRKNMAVLPAIMEGLGSLAVAGILMLSGYSIISNNADPGSFFAFIAVLFLSYQPLKRITAIILKVQMGVSGIASYYELLETQPDIIDSPNAKDMLYSKVALDFKNVSFAYTDGARNALSDIHITIQHGEKAALVGRSGSGKSTLMNLIPRFYDPTKGKILCNGIDLKDLKIQALRAHIAFVSQEIVLFNDTIYNNIAYSNPKATKEEVLLAAKRAHCLDFVEHLKNGLNTIVGPRGVMLSGGQRQRISIARALLKNAPVLLLDEATAALDTEAETVIQKALEDLSHNKTTITIAHRLSTVINADIIYVLSDGEIIEQGNHEELLKKNSHYSRLHQLQLENQNA